MSDDPILLTDPLPDPTTLRPYLICQDNPRRSPDYLIKLSVKAAHNRFMVRVFYVPDRLLLKDGSLETYLNALQWSGRGDLETLLSILLDALNNELVPRFIQISILSLATDLTSEPETALLIEDRQPSWDNPGLLFRIPGL